MEGKYLYEVCYWDGIDREIRRFKIKKVHKQNISVHYWQFRLKKKDIGTLYFIKRSNALLNALILHEEMLPFCEKYLRPRFEKEIGSLRRMLKRQLEKEKQGEAQDDDSSTIKG